MQKQSYGFSRGAPRRSSAVKTLLLAGILSTSAASLASTHGANTQLATKMALPGPGSTRCTTQAYVTNTPDRTISVIDTATDRVVATIPVGNDPMNPTFTPDGTQIYVSNVKDGTVSVIDVGSNKVVATLDMDGQGPGGLGFTPDGKYLLVTLYGKTLDTPGALLVIARKNGTVMPPIPLREQPERMAFSADGSHAYITHLQNKSVAVIDIARGAVASFIPTSGLPYNLVLDPTTHRLYVGHGRENRISVVDTKTNSVVDTIDTEPTLKGQPLGAHYKGVNGMAMSRDYKRLFITSVDVKKLQAITLATGKVTAAVESDGPGFINLSGDGRRGYFVHPFGGTVSVFDTTTLAMTDSIKMGRGPTVIAVCGQPASDK